MDLAFFIMIVHRTLEIRTNIAEMTIRMVAIANVAVDLKSPLQKPATSAC
jgi:hypothetical protein